MKMVVSCKMKLALTISFCFAFAFSVLVNAQQAPIILDCTVEDCSAATLNTRFGGKQMSDVSQAEYGGALLTEHVIVRWGTETTLTIDDMRIAAAAVEYGINELFRLGYSDAPYDDTGFPRILVGIRGSGPGFGEDLGFSSAGGAVIWLNQSRFDNLEILIATVAHELFHTYQLSTRPFGWWNSAAESAASFVSEDIFSDKSLYQSLQIPAYLFTPHISVFGAGDTSNDPENWQLGRLHYYGSYLFLRYLDEEYAPAEDDFGKKLITVPTITAPQTIEELNQFYVNTLWSDYQGRLPEVFSQFSAQNSVLDYQRGWWFQVMVDAMSQQFPQQDQRIVATIPDNGTGSAFQATPLATLPQQFAYNTVTWTNPDPGYWEIEIDGATTGSDGAPVDWYPTIVRVRNGEPQYFPISPNGDNLLLQIEAGDEVLINAATWSPTAGVAETFEWSYRVQPRWVFSRTRALVNAQGKWQKSCESPGRTATTQVAGNRRITEFTVYTEEDCTGFVWGKLRYENVMGFRFRWGGLSGYTFDSTIESIELTLTPEAVPSANASNHYGISDWEAGVPRSVSGFSGRADVGQVGDQSHGVLSPDGDGLNIAQARSQDPFPTEFGIQYLRDPEPVSIDSPAYGKDQLQGLWSRGCINKNDANVTFGQDILVSTLTVYTEDNCTGTVWGYLRYSTDYTLSPYAQSGPLAGWLFESTVDNITLELTEETALIARAIGHYGHYDWAPHVPIHVSGPEIGFVGDRSHGVFAPDGNGMTAIIVPIDQPIDSGSLRNYEKLY